MTPDSRSRSRFPSFVGPPRRETRSLAGLFLFAFAGCGTGEAGSAPGEPGAAYDGRVELEIGLLDGDDAYVFGRVTGTAQDTLGRVFVSWCGSGFAGGRAGGSCGL